MMRWNIRSMTTASAIAAPASIRRSARDHPGDGGASGSWKAACESPWSVRSIDDVGLAALDGFMKVRSGLDARVFASRLARLFEESWSNGHSERPPDRVATAHDASATAGRDHISFGPVRIVLVRGRIDSRERDFALGKSVARGVLAGRGDARRAVADRSAGRRLASEEREEAPGDLEGVVPEPARCRAGVRHR